MKEYPEGCGVVFGASGGLGIDIARRMAELGTDLVATYRSKPADLEALKTELEAAGRRLLVLQCDTTDGAAVQSVIDKARAEFGAVHSVVSATGSAYHYARLVEQPEADLRKVLDIDVIGFLNIAKAAVPALRDCGGGALVTVGTSGIDRTVNGNSLSAIPKAAVAMMVKLLALEEGAAGVRVNMVGPGSIEAGMALPMLAERRARPGYVDLVDSIPMRRRGQAEEFGGLVAFLTTQRASYITGQIVHVDGGLTA